MKTISIKQIILGVLATIAITSCKQDVITLKETTTVPPSKGSTDFTTYVAIGNSLTAGFQAGALFTDGQNNSFPKILSKQFSLAQDPTGNTTLAFNQPDIKSDNGYNASSSKAIGIPVGRLILFAADGIQADAVPTPCNPGLPPPYNTVGPGFTDGAFYNYTPDPAKKLNNFGAPGIILAQCLIPDTGNPGSPYYNPYYGRFASQSGVSTILHDAINRNPTFFTFDLGNNDVLGYATSGGDGSIPLTSTIDFQNYYFLAIDSLMARTTAKGVVTTIPDVTTIPFFLAVPWNAIAFASGDPNINNTNSAYASYNGGLDYALSHNYPGLTADEVAKRKISFAAGANGIVIDDSKYLTDLSGMGLPSIRQATATDLITLTAGAILGQEATPGDPTTVWGVGKAITDSYVLVSQEIDSVKTRTAAFNGVINSVASANSNRIVVADINAAFNDFMIQYLTNGGIIESNVLITPSLKPPFGAFSEDGVHPNSRGYAHLANIIIDAINNNPSVFGTGINVPKANIAEYSGTGLPYGPNGLIH